MNAHTRISVVTLTLLVMVGAATAQIITISTSADVIDFGGGQTVADLPGPDGKVSLAEAGLASDNTPGVQTIAFNVPQGEWEYQWLFPGRAVLRPFLAFASSSPRSSTRRRRPTSPATLTPMAGGRDLAGDLPHRQRRLGGPWLRQL